MSPSGKESSRGQTLCVSPSSPVHLLSLCERPLLFGEWMAAQNPGRFPTSLVPRGAHSMKFCT